MSWLKDLVEVKGWLQPSEREYGTDSLANYVRAMTPGEFIRKINKKDKVKLAR
jgi:hypothetical protein